MELAIEVEDGAGAELYQWLVEDPEVRRYTAGAEPVDGKGRSGEMGLGFDILNLVIPNAIALAGLVVSIASFRNQRRQSTGAAPTVAVRHGDVLVVVSGDGTEALQTLTQATQTPAPGTEPAQADGGTPPGTPATDGSFRAQPEDQAAAPAPPGPDAPAGGAAASP